MLQSLLLPVWALKAAVLATWGERLAIEYNEVLEQIGQQMLWAF